MKLRAFQESDWPRLAMLAASTEVNKTYMLPDFESPEKARPLFDRLSAMSRDASRYVRAMEENGEFVGFCNDVERSGDAVEIGYALCPDVWGRGYCTEAGYCGPFRTGLQSGGGGRLCGKSCQPAGYGKSRHDPHRESGGDRLPGTHAYLRLPGH